MKANMNIALRSGWSLPTAETQNALRQGLLTLIARVGHPMDVGWHLSRNERVNPLPGIKRNRKSMVRACLIQIVNPFASLRVNSASRLVLSGRRIVNR